MRQSSMPKRRWAYARAGVSGGGRDQARRAQNRAASIRTAGVADQHRVSDLAAVVGEGTYLHRSRDRDLRLEFWLSERGLWFFRPHAERAAGAGDHRSVRPDQSLRKADRAAGPDRLALDSKPLADLRAADVIDCK